MFTKLLDSYIEILSNITYDTFHVQRHKQLQRGFFMGKNSLVKSTTKGKKSAAKKKTAAKAAPKAKTKAKAAAKVKAAPKAKPAAKTAPKPKPIAKAAPAPEKKPVSVKDLLKKKFPVWKPEKLYTAGPDQENLKDVAAPPFVSGPEEEQKRIKELLLKKYDLAEIKAAGEKAAADKAAAEKAAADKAAADKAAEPEVSVSYEPPDADDTLPADPMEKGMKYLAAAFAVLILLVIGSSMINQGKYYIHSADGALEIFQGRFAPMGEKLLISLPGVQAPEKAKDIYSKTDVYPIIFNYYLEKADTFLKTPGLPDFEGIKKYLNKAMRYKTTPDSAEAVYSRLSNIDLMILLYKADVAASKPTLSDLKEAKGFLSEASRLDIDDAKLDLIHEKMDAVDKKIASLKAEQKGVTSPAPAPAPAVKTEAPTHESPEAPAPHAKPHG
jgi:colicin import membrane protein